MDRSLRCAHCHLPLPSRPSYGKINGKVLSFCCSGCLLVSQVMGQAGEEGEASWWLAKLGLGFFLAMNVMTLSLLLYSGSLTDLEPDLLPKIGYLSFALATPVILILGWPFFKNALHELPRFSFSMDSLIALGAAAAFTASGYAIFTKSPRIYFDTATMILVLVTLGRFLEASAKAKASEGVKKLLELSSKEATVIQGDKEGKVPLDQLKVGDRVKVLPGERIPVDGVVLEGETMVDESTLTGEARPVLKRKGDPVFGTSLNLDGLILVQAVHVGEETVLAQMVRLMEQAQGSRGPIRRVVDRVSSLFVPATLMIAFLTFLFWSREGLEPAFLNALAVLLIACPCPLGLATPLATWVSLERAASSGVLIRSGEALEQLSQLRAIFFDKTGTLTFGRMGLLQVRLLPEAGVEEEEFFVRCASLEACSEHALGRGFAQAAEAKGLALYPVSDFKAYPGLGIEGLVHLSGGKALLIMIGGERLVAERGWRVDEGLLREKMVLEAKGATVVLAGWEGEVKGLFAFGDSVRSEAKEAVEACRRLDLHVALITGDSWQAAVQVGEELGIDDVRAPLLPSEKVEAVRAAEAALGAVGMVGDGINDAPALAQASIGIAMGSGTDLAKETAGVSIIGSDLRKIPWLIGLAKATRRRIKGNLFWAFFYNTFGILLAAFGILRPVLAAAAMVLSSLFVVGNSLRLRKWEGGLPR